MNMVPEPLGLPLTGLAGLVVERVETFVVELPAIRAFEIAGGTVATAGRPSPRAGEGHGGRGGRLG